MSAKPAERPARIGVSAVMRFLLFVFVWPLAIFVAAGRWDWWPGWAVFAQQVFFTLASRAIVLRVHPDLIRERAAGTSGEGAKTWDQALVPIIALIGPLVTWIVAGLDERLGWPPVIPLWLQLAGLAGMLAGYSGATWAMVANRYFSAVVRIQADRGQTVVTGGPYRFVRHPGYAGGILAQLATPFLLGSPWAVVPAALTAGLTVVRTALEDRMLQAELPGYVEYARQTRYRLLPGVW